MFLCRESDIDTSCGDGDRSEIEAGENAMEQMSSTVIEAQTKVKDAETKMKEAEAKVLRTYSLDIHLHVNS